MTFRAIPCALLALAVAGAAQAEIVFATTSQGFLVSFDSSSPSNIIAGIAITGLQSNESLMGIDFRPANGQLYGLGNSNRVYSINTTTGVATAVGGAFTPALNGSSFSFDFNPTIDRIRVVSDANTNLVLNPNDGSVQLAATNVFYGPADPNFGADPNVIHSAYTSPAGQLYGIDTGLDILVTQANNAGTLSTVGPLGVQLHGLGGFDISSGTGVAYIAGATEGSSLSSFFSVNLLTGAATNLGEIGAGAAFITGIAVIPAPGALALLGLGTLIATRRRR
jgi:hypothetical protein